VQHLASEGLPNQVGRRVPVLPAEESAGADHLFFLSLIQPECDIAQAYCGEKLQEPFIEGEINPYDISKPCTTLGEDLCVSRRLLCCSRP